METRNYKVGEHVFRVELEEPWNFMRYTEPVKDRIKAAANGERVEIQPTRAGDDVPPRTLVKSKKELPDNFDKNTLDFSQYEPFRTTEEASLFSIKICGAEPAWIEEEKASGKIKLILEINETLPCYYVYDREGETLYEFDADRGNIAGILRVSKEYKYGEYYPKPGFSSYASLMHINSAIMIMYTYNASRFSTLLVHSSVIREEGKARLFLGTSGTGKSTHSRLWLNEIKNCDLINDDNPVIRLMKDEEGKERLYVFGSPWSGKTPCYRNIKVEVGSIVRLKQAGTNEIKELKGIQAYAGMVTSASAIKWDREIMDNLASTASRIVSLVSCFELSCRPEPEAARLCHRKTSTK